MQDEELDNTTGPPNYSQNINITPADKLELTWEIMMMDMINKAEDGDVKVPAILWNPLAASLGYYCAAFTFHN